MSATITGASEVERQLDRGTAFFGILALVTLIPLLTLPFYHLGDSPRVARFVLSYWMITGYAHVLSTLWFGLDSDYKEVIKEHPMRMMGSLILVPAIATGIALTSAYAAGWMFVAYMAWLVHHYNRQTYGIMALAAARDGYGKLPKSFDILLNVTTVAGAVRLCPMSSVFPDGSPLAIPLIIDAGWYIALVLLSLCIGFVGFTIATDKRLRSSPTTLLFLVVASIFYLPSLLPGSSSVTFWPYAMAHGAQYIVMMGVISRRSDGGFVGLSIMALLALVLGNIGYRMSALPWAQLYTGVVMWHFLADARLWRMRDPTVRKIMLRRFDFVFNQAMKRPRFSHEASIEASPGALPVSA